MRTIKSLISSRINGAKSRGPKSPEGKRRSSLNATRHGLLAKGIVLQNESEQTFAILVAQHILKLNPTDDVEQCAIEEMVASIWRLRRLWAIEKRLFDRGIEKSPELDEMDRIAGAFSALAAGPELHLLDRYESRLHRTYHRSLHNFLLLHQMGDPEIADIENNQTNLNFDNPNGIKTVETTDPPG